MLIFEVLLHITPVGVKNVQKALVISDGGSFRVCSGEKYNFVEDSQCWWTEWSTAVIRDHDVATPIIGPFRAWKPPIPYAIKNQRGAKL